MAHELAFINGRAQMAYLAREGAPWHGLGEALDEGQPLQVWAEKAGLDWQARSQPLYTRTPEGNLALLEGDKALIHSKTGGRLGIVRENYRVVQPREILEAYEHIAGAAGYKLHTAGNLRGGRRIWALADCGEEFYVGKESNADKVKRFLLMATSFDGSMSTIADLTGIRVVCQNTFAASSGGDGERARVKISHNAEFNPQDIRAALLSSPVEEEWKKFKERAMRLADRKVSIKEATEFFVKLFAANTEEKVDIESSATRSKVARVFELYKSGVGQDLVTAKGTAWGLFNAVTRWADHERDTRSDDARMDAAWFGDSANIKQRAMAEALALAA